MTTKPLTHDEAIDALCGCAATVTVPSYQEAIEGYFKLRDEVEAYSPEQNGGTVFGDNDFVGDFLTVTDLRSLLATAAADKAEKERLLGLAMTANGQKNETERLLIAERERSATLQARVRELEAGENLLNAALVEAESELVACSEYLDPLIDADGDSEGFHPNREMTLQGGVNSALRHIESVQRALLQEGESK